MTVMTLLIILGCPFKELYHENKKRITSKMNTKLRFVVS